MQGLDEGIHRVMHSLFRRIFARPATAEDVRDVIGPLQKRVAELENAVRLWADAHERLDLAFNSFRGRVYAWRKWEPATETPEKPVERPLSDPSLTKEQLRSRLLKPGKPYPHQN